MVSLYSRALLLASFDLEHLRYLGYLSRHLVLFLSLLLQFVLFLKDGQLETLFELFGRKLLFTLLVLHQLMAQFIGFKLTGCPFDLCLDQFLLLLVVLCLKHFHLLLQVDVLLVETNI